MLYQTHIRGKNNESADWSFISSSNSKNDSTKVDCKKVNFKFTCDKTLFLYRIKKYAIYSW
jgi:hypothetical protein